MDKNKENVPKIRFPEFTDPWEQRKLSELLISSDKRNNAGKYTQDDVLAASLGTELVKKHIFFGLRSTEESVKNYRVVNSGDVIYTKSPIKGYPNGIIRTNKGLEGIVPSLYCVYHSIANINSSFIQSYFEDKGRLDAYLYPMVNIGARNNVNITDLGFLEGTICIPQNIDEQNKIVDFFNHLTNLISFHQRKLEHLKDMKKGLLQKMFPKEGEKFPEVRFPGFTDPWEQRKLGEIVNVCSGKDYKHLEEGNIPVYGTGGYMLSVSNALSYSDDAIGIGRKGTIDKPYILKAPFWTVDTLFYCIPDDEHDLGFVFDIFQNVNWKSMDESTGVPSLSKTVINDVDVLMPMYKEQRKIGEYFSKIDTIITLQHRKLEHLQQQKKGLLQQMFI